MRTVVEKGYKVYLQRYGITNKTARNIIVEISEPDQWGNIAVTIEDGE